VLVWGVGKFKISSLTAVKSIVQSPWQQKLFFRLDPRHVFESDSTTLSSNGLRFIFQRITELRKELRMIYRNLNSPL